MLRPQSEATSLHLERDRDHEGGSKTAWCVDYWEGECPAREWWWRESKKSNNYAFQAAQNVQKGQFTALNGFKNAKNFIFYLKVQNKIYS
jgi:hypothetical protein